ncbi:hypothetical protein WJX72_005579 [[Myrmecia] bisecta]|uniref:Translocon-associated protein subunit alpha n=1 Tax=[Myrmecia] bisecta TaxID=41462 RepID=A0AAW1QRH0_9CHLO
MKLSTALLLAAILASAWQGALAQAAGAQRHPLTDPPPPAPGVDTEVWFPKHLQNQLQFTVGEPVDVVVGFHNGGDERLNITGIMGSLNLAEQPAYFVQNFSGQGYAAALNKGEEASLHYTFTPAANLPQREFIVALTVFYQSQASAHSTLFFNKTIDVIERPSWVDTELLFLWALLAAALGSVGVFLYKYVNTLAFVKKARKQPRKTDSTKVRKMVAS